MLTNLFLSARFNQLVFNGRNQHYGAFELRQSYTKRLLLATGFPLLLLGSLGLGMFLNPKPNPVMSALVPIIDSLKLFEVEPFKKIEFEKPKPLAATKALLAHGPSDQYVIKHDNEVDPPKKLTGPSGRPGDGKADSLSGPPTPPIPPMPPTPPLPPSPPKIYSIVEQMPEFPGGEEEMVKFISRKLHYPTKARDMNIEGMVVLSFIVETDGSLTDLQVLRGVGGGITEEAEQIVGKMPKWKPGNQQGHSVPVRMSLPIRFQLDQ